MPTIFLPSCKLKAKYPAQSLRLREYLAARANAETVGCGKQYLARAKEDISAIVVCNNCAAIMEESSPVHDIQYAWSIIDADPAFPFPDYGGERMTVQDCWKAYDRRNVQNAVRSLLRKMNIQGVEQAENFDRTGFCGTTLLDAPFEIGIRYAPKRYANAPYRSLPPEEQSKALRAHCVSIATDRVVCYCPTCMAGIERGGKRAVHLIELLFPI